MTHYSHYEKLDGIERCIDDELPFEIPESWAWVRLSSISSKVTDGEHKTPRRVPYFCGFFLLSARNIRDGYIMLDDVDFVDSNEYGLISQRCNPKLGDVLISCSGSVGRCAVVEDDNAYVMVRSAAMVTPLMINSKYIMYCIQSPCVQSQIKSSIKQAVQANLFQAAIRQLILPIPPLHEQEQIVEAIQSIFPIVREL